VPAPERPSPQEPSLNPVDKAKDVAGGVTHPVETSRELAAEAQSGRSARTPLIALTGVTLFITIVVVLVLAVALILYFTLGGGSNH
jgi:hypothetical protein